MSETPLQNRERSEDVAPVAYGRATPLGAKVSLAALIALTGLLVTVFGFLFTGYRETQARLDSNFQSYAATNAAQHKELADGQNILKSFLCTQFPKWKRCE